MATLITFYLASDDSYVRPSTRATTPEPPCQMVIVDDRYATSDRLLAAMARQKYRVGKPYGGAESRRLTDAELRHLLKPIQQQRNTQHRDEIGKEQKAS